MTFAAGPPDWPLFDLESMVREVKRLEELHGQPPVRLEVSAEVWEELAKSPKTFGALLPPAWAVWGIHVCLRPDLAPGEWAAVYRARRKGT